jgi:predicted phage replisome organizer
VAADIKWIKVITDIFEDKKIKLIKSMPEGRTLVLIWFQLLIQAGKTNASGWIYLSEGCAYTPAMLATLFNESQQMIELALKLFSTKPFELIDISDDGLIYIPNWEKHQNVESMDKIREKERLRKANQREKQRQKLLLSQDSHGTGHGTSQQSHATEIELEKEKDTTTSAREILEQARRETAATIEPEYETVMEIHKKVFGSLFMTGVMDDYVGKLRAKGYQDAFIKELMLETGESGNKPSVRLMQTIGDRWMKEGIYSRVESKRRHDLDKQKVVSFQPNKQQQAAPKEFIPDENDEVYQMIKVANGDVR